MSEQEIIRILRFTRFNLECEGFIVTKEDEKRGREILEGKISADDAVKAIEKKYGVRDQHEIATMV